MGSFSIWHWLIVLAVVLILFGGGGKIPIGPDYVLGYENDDLKLRSYDGGWAEYARVREERRREILATLPDRCPCGEGFTLPSTSTYPLTAGVA